MNYVLYVGENCHDCKKVCRTIVEMRLDIPILNIDEGAKPPIDLFIFPALLSEKGDLKAYGLDIIEFLKYSKDKAPKISFFKRMFNTVKKYC